MATQIHSDLNYFTTVVNSAPLYRGKLNGLMFSKDKVFGVTLAGSAPYNYADSMEIFFPFDKADTGFVSSNSYCTLVRGAVTGSTGNNASFAHILKAGYYIVTADFYISGVSSASDCFRHDIGVYNSANVGASYRKYHYRNTVRRWNDGNAVGTCYTVVGHFDASDYICMKTSYSESATAFYIDASSFLHIIPYSFDSRIG